MNKLLFLSFAVVIAQILVRIVHYPNLINCDAALTLQEAELILQGKLPYVDFVNIELPPFYYLYVPVAWLAHYVSLGVPILSNLFFLLLLIYSLLSAFFILSHRVCPIDWEWLAPVLFAFVLFNLPAFHHFGQKEHIFILVFMPFFLLRWLRRQNQNSNNYLALLVGSLAAIGSCIKPHFLIPVIALELYWLTTQKNVIARLKDTEVISYMVTVLVITFMFLNCVPMRDALLLRWLPVTLNGSAAFYCDPNELLFLRHWNNGLMTYQVWPTVIVCILGLIICRSNSITIPLIIWTIAGYTIYLLQQKAYAYHVMVMLVGCFLLASLELSTLARWLFNWQHQLLSRLETVWGKTTLSFTIFLFIFPITFPFLLCDSLTTGASPHYANKILRKYSSKNDTVLVLSQNAMTAPCLLQTSRLPATRYLYCYPLIMLQFLSTHTNSVSKQREYYADQVKVAREIQDDISKSPPHIILVDESAINRWDHVFAGRNFEMLLNDYNFIGCNWNNYSVWERRQANSN